MKLISWNTNGFRATVKSGNFKWIEEIDPDILCLQEVKAELQQVEPFPDEFDRYPTVFWNASTEKKGYSGTATFCKDNKVSVIYGIGDKEFDHEGRVIETDHEDFVLFNIYFPNSGQDELRRLDYKIKFNKLIEKRVKALLKEGREVIVTGDYNVAHKEIDIARPKENEGYSGFTKEERAWMDDFVEIPMIDTFREFHPEPQRYSWWNMRFGARKRNIGWRIDYFCVSEGLKKRVKNADILDQIIGSDHAPILLEID